MLLLEIENPRVEIDGEKIVRGVDLAVNAGDVHAIMRPNNTRAETDILVQTLVKAQEFFT
ncbi:MAG TPA: hypothetical protein VH678_04865 [Xanthobacteraceae bacterium]|jgi:Fe-S cluster assembly ATP-binding protein